MKICSSMIGYFAAENSVYPWQPVYCAAIYRGKAINKQRILHFL